jgi:hypothetical protein
MKTPRSLVALTGINIALVFFTVVQQLRPAFAQGDVPVLRGRALEIVDAQGRIRASINVLPSSRSTSGEDQAETVLLRLITERGLHRSRSGPPSPRRG